MKKNVKQVCQEFGLRPTRARQGIFAELSASGRPLSVPELLARLAKKGIELNKTTLYRELERLVVQGILQKVQLSESRVSYELSGDHHHHFVCQVCSRVTKLSFCDPVLKTLDTILAREGKHVTRHTFELFGVCELCV